MIHSKSMQRQRGAALIIALLVLMMMTMIGITSMEGIILEEKMAGAYNNQQQAFNASENALRAGERWLWDRFFRPLAAENGFDGIYPMDSRMIGNTVRDFWNDRDNWPSASAVHVVGDGNSTSYSDSFTALNRPPIFVIEQLPEVINDGSGGYSLQFAGGQGQGVGSANLRPKIVYYRITGRAVGGTGNEHVITQSTYALTF